MEELMTKSVILFFTGSLLKQGKCNKFLLSPASVESVEYQSLLTGCCPSVGELCWGMLDTCLPRIPQSQEPAVCTQAHIAFICFRIDPNDADLILQSCVQITLPLPSAGQSMGREGGAAPVEPDLKSWYSKIPPSIIPPRHSCISKSGAQTTKRKKIPLQLKEVFLTDSIIKASLKRMPTWLPLRNSKNWVHRCCKDVINSQQRREPEVLAFWLSVMKWSSAAGDVGRMKGLQSREKLCLQIYQSSPVSCPDPVNAQPLLWLSPA